MRYEAIDLRARDVVDVAEAAAPGILTPFAGQGARTASARRPRVAAIRAGEAPLSRW